MAGSKKDIRQYSIHSIISLGVIITLLLVILIYFLMPALFPSTSYRVIFNLIGALLICIPLISIIFGIAALIKIRKDNSLKGKTLAISGIIISMIFIVLFLYFLLSPHPSNVIGPYEETPIPLASISTPITISESAIVIDKSKLIGINIFNVLNNTLYEAQPSVACPTLGNKNISRSFNKNIEVNSSVKYGVLLQVDKYAPVGKYICTVCVKDNSSNGECNSAYVPIELTLEIK